MRTRLLCICFCCICSSVFLHAHQHLQRYQQKSAMVNQTADVLLCLRGKSNRHLTRNGLSQNLRALLDNEHAAQLMGTVMQKKEKELGARAQLFAKMLDHQEKMRQRERLSSRMSNCLKMGIPFVTAWVVTSFYYSTLGYCR